MTATQTILERGAIEAQSQVERVVQETAQEARVAPEVAHGFIARHLIAWLRTGVTAALDGRSQRWRVRIRLYRDGVTDPAADTDAELPADRPGEMIIRGLPAVALELSQLAEAFHATAHEGQAVTGLDMPTLKHRLKSLRPTISRRRGDAVWRVPYKVGNTDWLARVDIQREGETDQ